MATAQEVKVRGVWLAELLRNILGCVRSEAPQRGSLTVCRPLVEFAKRCSKVGEVTTCRRCSHCKNSTRWRPTLIPHRNDCTYSQGCAGDITRVLQCECEAVLPL